MLCLLNETKYQSHVRVRVRVRGLCPGSCLGQCPGSCLVSAWVRHLVCVRYVSGSNRVWVRVWVRILGNVFEFVFRFIIGFVVTKTSLSFLSTIVVELVSIKNLNRS